jgi:hypothetical protein
MSRNAAKDESTTIALRIRIAQLLFLRKQAQRNESNVSAEVREMIDRAMEQEREAA